MGAMNVKLISQPRIGCIFGGMRRRHRHVWLCMSASGSYSWVLIDNIMAGTHINPPLPALRTGCTPNLPFYHIPELSAQGTIPRNAQQRMSARGTSDRQSPHVGEVLDAVQELGACEGHGLAELGVQHGSARVLVPPRVQLADPGA